MFPELVSLPGLITRHLWSPSTSFPGPFGGRGKSRQKALGTSRLGHHVAKENKKIDSRRPRKFWQLLLECLVLQRINQSCRLYSRIAPKNPGPYFFFAVARDWGRFCPPQSPTCDVTRPSVNQLSAQTKRNRFVEKLRSVGWGLTPIWKGRKSGKVGKDTQIHVPTFCLLGTHLR